MYQQACIDASKFGVDWFLWRIAVSEHIKDGLSDIKMYWSIKDLIEAHVVLDTLQRYQEIAKLEAKNGNN
jgi:hypothetical protein